ncbi:MAG: glutamate synthase central domain-containing protein [Acinetobacter parvus]
MGDDTPMAVLSRQVRHVSDYFRQQFAQGIIPPIDPLRESIVMSLETCLGREQNVFEQGPEHADRIIISSPVLSHSKMQQLRDVEKEREGYSVVDIDLNYAETEGLQAAIARICEEAAQAVRDGKTLIVLTDKNIREGFLPANSALATGAVHHHLIKRLAYSMQTFWLKQVLPVIHTNLQYCSALVLQRFTLTWLYDVINDLVAKGELLGDPIHAQTNFRKGIEKGLLKVLSKMGISTVASYRGGQLFEAVGFPKLLISVSLVYQAVFKVQHLQI